jgi:hypothetical protein
MVKMKKAFMTIAAAVLLSVSFATTAGAAPPDHAGPPEHVAAPHIDHDAGQAGEFMSSRNAENMGNERYRTRALSILHSMVQPETAQNAQAKQ